MCLFILLSACLERPIGGFAIFLEVVEKVLVSGNPGKTMPKIYFNPQAHKGSCQQLHCRIPWATTSNTEHYIVFYYEY